MDLYIKKGSTSGNELKEKPNQKAKSKNVVKWSRQEVFTLIRLWEQFQEDVNEGKNNPQIFEKIAADLQQQKQRERPLTAKDVQTKVNILKKRYK